MLIYTAGLVLSKCASDQLVRELHPQWCCVLDHWPSMLARVTTECVSIGKVSNAQYCSASLSASSMPLPGNVEPAVKLSVGVCHAGAE